MTEKRQARRRVREPIIRQNRLDPGTDGNSPEERNNIMPNSNVNSRTLKLAKLALMTAVSVICSFLYFPILFTAPFLKFEVSDIPILIAAFVFGPVSGITIGVVSILLNNLLIGSDSGSAYGTIMHILAVVVYVLVASAIYQKFKTKKGGLIALIIGGLCMTASMIPANLLITPHFMGVPLDAVQAMIPTAILPFNLLKTAIITVAVFFLYKRLSPFLHKWE